MPLWNLTEEKVAEMLRQKDDKMQQYKDLEGMHIYDMWERDLNAFVQALKEYEEEI